MKNLFLILTILVFAPSISAKTIQFKYKVDARYAPSPTATVAPTATPTPTAKVRRSYSKKELISMICKKFGSNGDLAVAISYAESGLNCNPRQTPNHNGTYDHGLMQINDIHQPKYGKRDVLDCKDNLDIAHEIYRGSKSNFTPWSTFNNGEWKKHFEHGVCNKFKNS